MLSNSGQVVEFELGSGSRSFGWFRRLGIEMPYSKFAPTHSDHGTFLASYRTSLEVRRDVFPGCCAHWRLHGHFLA